MADTLISFLEGVEPVNEVQATVKDIVLLQVRIDNFGEHELTLKEAHQNLLNLSKEKYAQLVVIVNESSLEQLASHVERVRSEIKKFTSEHEMNSITGQKVNSLNSQIKAIQLIQQAKEKYGTLKPLDELMKDERFFMKLFS